MEAAREYPDDVHVLEAGGREFILVGTAHISRESAELVREVIEKERPDAVCVELDAQRFQALAEKQRWNSLDLKQVIRSKQLSALIVNLLLASYQKKLGGALGVVPGTELLEATKVAKEYGIPVALCDRDVRITLRRAWASMSFFKKAQLLSVLLAGAFTQPDLSEEELRRIRQRDVLTELMDELGEALPEIKRVLIDERDAYLAHKIRETPGRRIVAVVGAGHVEGMSRALLAPQTTDLSEFETVPPLSAAWKWVGWGIPATIVGSLGYIAWSKGAEVAGQNLLYWIVANGVPSTLGAVVALAHPVTIAAAFFVAPITSLTPVIGAGYVLAFLQAWIQPPFVWELEHVADEAASPGRWWRNRLLRILLVFVLTTIGSLIGTYVGGYEILSNLF
jgi:pheromone shutdown-related protein TraB